MCDISSLRVKPEGQDTSMKKHEFMYSYSAKTDLSC